MPLIAVNLSDRLLQEIRELVDSGRYATLESFIEIGAFNQLALERGSSPAEIIQRGHRRGNADAHPPPAAIAAPKAKRGQASTPSDNGAKKPASVGKVSKVDVIEPVSPEDAALVFSRFTRAESTKAVPAKMPEKAVEGERIFGQVNRLFPAKLVCRWLATTAATDGQWSKFTAISARLADDAGTIGSLLDEWDQKEERERGSELSIALPRRKNNASIDRFLSQFVARITRASEISPGAVCQYEFARFEDACLLLTEQGVEFAALENPILDAHDEQAQSALTEMETTFLANHIKTWVPTEWADMKTVLAAVQAGKASPTEVATAVRADLPEGWTDSMVQTHISGVIARLSDIRLLSRSWQGRNVRYELGPAEHVNNFLSTHTEGHL